MAYTTEDTLVAAHEGNTGKTKDVADALKDAYRYGSSGSLYALRDEIISLQAAGFDAGLSPFVTDASMQVLLNKVEEYLNITPLTDWS